eukprot:s25_g43.t1
MTQHVSPRLSFSSKNSIPCKTTGGAGCSPPQQGLPEKNGDHCCVKAGHERPHPRFWYSLMSSEAPVQLGCWALGVLSVYKAEFVM